MKKLRFTLLIIIAMKLVAFADNGKKIDPEIKNKAEQWMQVQPVRFLENMGQMTDHKGNPVPFVLFKAAAWGMDMYITEKGLTYLFLKMEEENHDERGTESSEKREEEIRYNRIDMDLKGATIKRENILKEFSSVASFNYFYPHCSEGIYNVKQYEKITIKNIYPDIDWVLYNAGEKGFKYDFVVHPHADPFQIKLIYRSEHTPSLKEDGSFFVETELGALTENAPECYSDETKEKIASRFIKTKTPQKNETEVSFEVENYDPSQTLVIDPQLVWSTFYGGSSIEGPLSADCDTLGNIYISGYTNSSNFLLLDPGTPTYFDGSIGGSADVSILKFTNAGVLLWATYYGGMFEEYGWSITCDINNNVFVTGYTGSSDFPTLDPGGSTYYQPAIAGSWDGFIIKFDNVGALEWATFYGGTNSEGDGYKGASITSDNNSNIFVTGYTSSADFPTFSPGGGGYFDPNLNGWRDAYILKFDNTGVPLWATYYGGSNDDWAYSIACDNNNDVLITGNTTSGDLPVSAGAFQSALAGGTTYGDAFILKFDNTGVPLWATFYGGSAEDIGCSVTSDNNNNVLVTGRTSSADFPVQDPGGGAYYDNVLGGTWDSYILKLGNNGTPLWSSFYGGSNAEAFYMSINSYGTFDNIVTDSCDNVYIAFQTLSAGVTTLNPGCGSYYSPTYGGAAGLNMGDIFLVKFNNTGALLWATYWGGTRDDYRSVLAIDDSNNLFLAGEWISYTSVTGLPLINPFNGAYFDDTPNAQDDGFIAKFIPSAMSHTVTSSGSCLPCMGTATVVAACASPYSYSWSTSPVQTTQIATGLCAGIYSVTVTGNCNIAQTSTVSIASNSSLVTINGLTTVCAGQNTTLTASGGTSYSWNIGATTTSILVSPTASTGYTVSGTDINGCPATASVTVTVIPTPTINITGPTTICNGSTTLTASGGISYNWNTAETTTSIVVSPTANASYTVTGTNSGGCSHTTTVAVTLSPGPAITTISTSSVICPGTSVTLTAGGGVTYSWSTSQTGNPITVSPTGTTTYTVIGTDANGCGASALVTITVTPTPIVTPSAATICSGNSTTLVASGGVSYSWSPGGMTTDVIAVSPTMNTTYTVVVTAANSCTNSTTVLVTVNSTPTITATPVSTTICAGSNVTLTAGGGVTYLWSNTQTTNPMTVSPPVGTSTYTVIATDANGCSNTASATITTTSSPTITITGAGAICPGNSVTLTAAGGVNYSWNTTQTINSITVSPTGTSTYTVIGTDANGCSGSALATITVTPTPVVTPSAATICSGNSTTLVASGGVNYSWSPGGVTTSVISVSPTMNTTYTVVVTAANSCTNSTTALVTVNSTPTVTVIPASATICAGSNATLTAGGGVNYVWSTTQTINPITVSPTGISTYTVIGTDVNGCTNIQMATIVQSAALSVGITPVNASCLNNDGFVSVNVSGGTLPYSYNWNPSGQTTATATGLSGVTVYTVTITDVNGCSLFSVATVSVSPGPTANAGVDVTINAASNTTLSVITSGGTSYSWSTGQTTSSIMVSPPTTTTYSVIVTDANGCTAVDVVTVFVQEDCSQAGEPYLPNAFSPNNDGENDVLQLYYGDMDCIKEFQLIIYDRWGEKVFYSKDAKFTWNGNYRGMVENSTVFVYYMTATLISEGKVVKKGNVSLLR